MTESPFLSTKQAAEYLGLSHRTLEKLRVVGGSPEYRKHGQRVLYAREDLQAWSDERRRRSTSDNGPPEAA